MVMMFTHISKNVLEFYKELPFNYRESVEEQALSVLQNKNTYDILNPFLKPKTKVLEIGCGAGWFSNSIVYHNDCDVTAIDFNPIVIERAQFVAEYLGQYSKVNFQVADLFEYKIEPVDLIVSLGVLHHTEDCMGALTKICQSAENHIFIGLYHKYGRKPFLEEFKSMDNEDKMFERYCELDSRFTDETHLRSWFRDQVLHPHETTHTMEEVNEILYENNMELIWSSIEGDEKLYEDLTRAKLSNNEYWPGFFTFLARRI